MTEPFDLDAVKRRLADLGGEATYADLAAACAEVERLRSELARLRDVVGEEDVAIIDEVLGGAA